MTNEWFHHCFSFFFAILLFSKFGWSMLLPVIMCVGQQPFFPISPFGTTLCSERFFDGILFIQPITQNILKYECITKSFSQLITYIFHSLLKHKKIEATQYSKIRIEILKVRAIRPKSKFSYFEIFRVNMINSNQYN